MAQAKKSKIFFLILVLAAGFVGAAFRLLDDPITTGLIQKFEKYTQTYVPEKVYLHLDKPYYVAGEDIWFKGYLVNGTSHTPTAISDNLYVELISPDGEIINRHILKIENGFTSGDFDLADSIETGTYNLRAYTHWMRNFPETYFFHRPLQIYNDRNYTNPDAKNRQSRSKTAKLNTTTGKSDLDVQFFPEGGNLVAGITTRIGFKALNRWGKGGNISGSILDAAGKELNSFKSAHFGMGHFVFLPAKGQSYTARIKTADGRSLAFPFPPVQDKGTVLQAINFPSGDIRVVMSQPETHFSGERTFILIAQMRGVHFYAASVKPSKKDVVFQIPANVVPGLGIAQITLFDAATLEPLNERLIFIKPKQKLKLAIQPDKGQYKARERVQLNITATDPAGNPVAGEFSLAVTDASLPPENAFGNLSSYFLLSSDLPGTIEQPDFYFQENNPDALQALDNLMLTQGWRRFVWKDILTETYPPLQFYPEQGLAVSGQINRLLTNKPLANAEVLLVNSGTDGFIIQTKTDAAGRFGVNGLDYDSVRTLFVQAKNEKGKANTLVILDKASIPPLQFLSPVPAEDISLSEAYIQKIKNQQKINDAYAFKNGERVLKEVQVTAKRQVVPEKTRIYGTADNVIKMTDQMASFSNVLQVLQGRVAGVNVAGGGMNMQVSIRGGGEPLFLLDEIPVDVGMISSISPTDVETIEVLKGTSAAIYGSRGGNGVIAVYTKRGGAVVDNRPAAGTTIGRIFGYYKAREFFSPRYDVMREVHNLPDLRSTIYWNSRVKTDSTGKATVTFYNADQVNGLRVIVEGLTPTGYVGSLTARFPAQ